MGNKIKNHFKMIFDLEHELFTYIRQNLQLTAPKGDQRSKDAVNKILLYKRDCMFSAFGEEPDEFNTDLKLGIDNIEKYLKPKLRHDNN